MQQWMFEAMQKIARGEKLNGNILMGLKELGYIFLDQATETWLPTPEANEEFKQMAREMETGKAVEKN